MRNKKAPRHDILHLIGAILAPLMFKVLQENKPFELDTYVALLKKYKNKKPDKIWDYLEKETDL